MIQYRISIGRPVARWGALGARAPSEIFGPCFFFYSLTMFNHWKLQLKKWVNKILHCLCEERSTYATCSSCSRVCDDIGDNIYWGHIALQNPRASVRRVSSVLRETYYTAYLWGGAHIPKCFSVCDTVGHNIYRGTMFLQVLGAPIRSFSCKLRKKDITLSTCRKGDIYKHV